jgi:hypothetical protein
MSRYFFLGIVYSIYFMAVDNQVITRVLLIGLAIAVLAILIIQYQHSVRKNEKFVVPGAGLYAKSAHHKEKEKIAHFTNYQPVGEQPAPFNKDVVLQEANTVLPSEPQSNETYRAVDFVTESKLPKDACFPRDKTTAEELLPKDAANSMWAQVAPAGQGDVSNQNYLTAGFMVGIDTIGQSLRNANYQLRSDPPNPRFAVGPWMQSTIEYDNNHRSLEIGSSSC